MKHIFVVNPCAGKQDPTSLISQAVEAYASLHPDFDHQIYLTRSPGDATDWVGRWCCAHPDTPARFYACGGDGTLNEVVNGLVGYPQVELTCVASGSGNDFIKCYGSFDDFNDIPRLVNGTAVPVDVMRVNNRYCINVCNFGFDAMVCKTMNDVRRRPLIGGRNAYTTGILRNLFTARSNYIRMKVNGEPFFEGKMLLSTLSNGRYVGGAYQCGPRSKNDDGLIDINLFKRMSLPTFARLIGPYAQGTYMEHPLAKGKMLYKQGASVDLSAHKPFWFCIDGEMVQGSHFQVEIMKHALRFVKPL